MEQPQPLFTERHVTSLNITLMLGIAFVFLGTFSDAGLIRPHDFIVIGLGAAAYSWLTTPSSYGVYTDRLVVFYGRPRIRHVLFEDIDHIDVLKFSFGNRMWVRVKNGKRIVIQPKSLEEFQEKFKEAMDSHLGGRTDQSPVEES